MQHDGSEAPARCLSMMRGIEARQCHNGIMELPPDTSIRWLVRRYAQIISREQDRQIRRPAVLPNGQFFPDEFDGDAGSVNLLFWRLQEHSALTDVDVELRFLDDGGSPSGSSGCGSGCGSEGCGSGGSQQASVPLPPVSRMPDAFRVDVLSSQARTPVTLTAYLSTALGRVHLERTGGLSMFPTGEWRSICELSAVSLGFGVLLANASHMFSKACHGVRVARATALSVSEITLALALFVSIGDNTPWPTNSLDTTQKAAMSEAKLWIDSNQKVIRRLKRNPGEVGDDDMLEVMPALPWLARVLGLGGKKRGSEVFDDDGFSRFEADMNSRASKTKTKSRDHGELRAMVDESLDLLHSAE